MAPGPEKKQTGSNVIPLFRHRLWQKRHGVGITGALANRSAESRVPYVYKLPPTESMQTVTPQEPYLCDGGKEAEGFQNE